MKSRILTPILAFTALSIFGCATASSPTSISSKIINNPNNAAALNDVVNGVLSYTQGNTVGAAVDAAQGLSAFIWGLSGTPQSGNPVAIASTTTTANTKSAQLTTALVTAASTLTASGATPDSVTNTLASVVYNAATKGKATP